MALIFVYGSLKKGFVNEHVNTGRAVPGRYRTRERYPLYLLGEGHVPCLVDVPDHGEQIVGELYEVDDAGLARMDRLEEVGEPGGYERIEILVERTDAVASAPAQRAHVYVRHERDIPPGTPRIGPFGEYTPEHAKRFRWP